MKKQTAEIEVHSSTPDITYTITITAKGEKASIECSCQAGQRGIVCKHVLAAMEGDESILWEKWEDQEEAWKKWQSLFARSELSVLARDYMQEIAELEKQILALQKKTAGLKKGLARVTLG